MKTRIVRIGNSRGLRIPKPLLEEAGLNGEVEIHVHNDSLVIKAVENSREGWAEAFREMAKLGDDTVLDSADSIVNHFDEEEWEW